MKKGVWIGIFVCLVLVGLVSGIGAFEDTFQYHHDGWINDTWDVYHVGIYNESGGIQGDQSNNQLNNTWRVSQTYVAQTTGILKCVYQAIGSIGNDEILYMEIRNSVGNKPGNTIYGSFTSTYPDFHDGGYRFGYFNIPITEGEYYQIVYYLDVDDVARNVGLRDALGWAGNFSYSHDHGSTWTLHNSDMSGGGTFIAIEDNDTVYNYPSEYPYSKTADVHLLSDRGEIISRSASGIFDYFSFSLRPDGFGGVQARNYRDPVIFLFDISGNMINAYSLKEYVEGHEDKDELWEFLVYGNHLYLTINGTNQGSIGSCSDHPAYLEIYLQVNSATRHLYIDDISFSNAVGIGKDCYPSDAEYNGTHEFVISDIFPASEPDYELDVSYTIKTVGESPTYTASEYRMKVENILTGEITADTLIKEAGNSSVKPCGIIEYNRSTVLGSNWGLYYFYTTKNGALAGQDYLYWISNNVSGNSYLNFQEDMYGIGEDADISYYIDGYSASCNYHIRVFDKYGSEKWSSSVIGESGSETFSTIDWDSGLYQGVLTEECSGEVGLAYDIMVLSDTANIRGITYDAETETALATVNVSYQQGAVYYNTTSNATGHYNLSGLPIDIETFVNATKTNYTHEDWSFTPLKADTYEIDLYLLPNETYISHTNTSIGGLVTRCPFHQAINGATVYLWNTSSSWNQTNTTNSKGYYLFDDIPNGTTYKINASYVQCDTEEDDISTNDGGYKYHYFCLQCWYNLTVKARDAETHNTIITFSAVLNEGEQIGDTITGTLILPSVYYGIHRLETTADGYYTSIDMVYVANETEKIVYLTRLTETEGGPGVYYPPRLVEFRIQDIYGNPFSDVYVTAVGIQTTMGSWDWLKSILGFDDDAADAIQNTTMNGTTDSTGSITFLMVETIKYTMTFTKGSDVNETLTIYPKEERYIVIVGRTGFFDVEPQLFGEQIKWNFTSEIVDSDDAWLNFSYNDTLNETTSGSYYIFTVNETTGGNTTGVAGLQKINMSNRTYYCSTPESFNSSGGVWYYNCTVHNYRGNTYILGFNATHTTAGEFGESVSVFFRYNHPLIHFTGWTKGYYNFLSIALLVFFSLLFSGTTVKVGAILLPLFAFLLFGIGWFNPTNDLVTSGILLGIAVAIGAGIYITTTGREKNLAS